MGKASACQGLRILFDPALDRSSWPGPLPHGGAVIGEAWLGLRGILGRLETELGLAGLAPSGGERAVQLAGELARTEGFWSESFAADALGTAERLVADRDRLRMWGWRGEPVSERLGALARVTSSVLPGLPDRLEAIAAELAHGRPDIASIELGCPAQLLPPLWRRVLAALQEAGVPVSQRAQQLAPAAGDLGAARRERFEPAGDGTLILFRPHGPLAAAEEVAGALAARASIDDVLIVGADRVLADALGRAGLPRPPAPEDPGQALGAMRLVVELMFQPADPALVYKLLCLDPGPVPRGLSGRLAAALASSPGRGSSQWRAALRCGLERIQDDDRRGRVRARLQQLLEPMAGRDETVPAAAVAERMRALSVWARGVADRAPSVMGLAVAADSFARLVQQMPSAELTRVELRRLLDDSDRIGGVAPPAEAGLAAVDRPGAVLGPAPIIIWWGFTRDRAPRHRRLRLSEAERAALVEHGITPPDAAVDAALAARHWRRPLEQATEALVLVCPRTVEANGKGFPHPLWDELSAAAAGRSASLVSSELRVPASPRRSPVTLQPLPEARPTWTAGRPISLRDRESPSSLESLLGCALQWALRYPGKLGSWLSPPAAPGPLLYGKIAHAIMAEVFADGAPDPDEARTRARQVLDRDLLAMCETLFLPRYQLERATVEQAVIESAAELARLIAEAGATVRGAEHELGRDLPELSLRGFADLLLADPDAVIDLKWSKTSNRQKLADGTALQLAAYAELARTGAARPQIAYFILRSQELVAEPNTSFAGADVPGEHQAIDIWRGAIAALEVARAELAAGRLHSPAAVTDDVEAGLAGGHLTLVPRCDYCSYAALCGRGAGR